MNTLIKNALILDMTERNKSYRGDIKIENGKISDNPLFHADREIDATNMICMPSLINAHTHTSMGLMRNYKDTAPDLMSWLNEIFPIEAQLEEEDIYWASQIALAEMISTGCTAFNDMYFMMEQTCEATYQAKMRANIGMTLFGSLKDNKERFNPSNKIADKYLSKANGLIRFNVAPHAIYTTPLETYLFARDWILERGGDLHTHMSETKTEVDNCLKEFGETPLMYLEKNNALKGIKSVLAHGVYLSDDEIKLCSDKGISIVHNPSSNCKLASGIAPIAKFKNANVNVAIGTDGASSNNNLNMMEEMHLAAMISCVSTLNPIATTPYDIIKMATLGGAKALSIDDKVGTIEVGKDADIILIDTNKPHLTPINDPFSAVVYSAQGSDVDTVFCKGEMLMQNRKLLTLDIDLAMEKTKLRWNRLLSKNKEDK
jgi:5-methylthioadenosine/S-adenosylhomocysteine deaminase